MVNNIPSRKKSLSFLHEKCGYIFHDCHKVCGVYAIFNNQNGKVYIGKTTGKLEKYIRVERLQALRAGKMHNKALQKDFIKYGEENFDFYILEKFSISDIEGLEKNRLHKTIDYLEVFYIAKFKSNQLECGYNVEIGGDNKTTLEEIQKLVKMERLKMQEWAYGDFTDSRSLPFSIPKQYISAEKIKYPKGLGSIMGQFVIENQDTTSFEDYLNEFLVKYNKKEYVKDNLKLVPQLLVQSILNKFPNTPKDK